MILTNSRPEPDRYMTRRDIEEYTDGVVKAATLAWWDHEGKGRGPKSFKLGAKKVLYKKSDVDAWIDAAYNAEEAR